MKANDLVMIYEDPITQLRPEGIATLNRKLESDQGDGMSRWEVTFKDEPFRHYERAIFSGAVNLVGLHEITIKDGAAVLARLTVQREPGMDDTDFNIKLTETVVEWASRSGRVYDDLEWEWL